MATGGLVVRQEEITVPNDPYSDVTDDCRVWLGNLDTRLTEYSLLKILQKYGPLKRFDFLLHKSGPDVGKPRGYCFVSFQHRVDAEKAVKGLNGKQALSKHLIVKWAHAEKQDVELPTKHHAKPTPVSFNSKPVNHSPESTIQAIEAKLKSMEESSGEFSMSSQPSAPPGSSKLSAVNTQAKQQQQNLRKSKTYHRPYNRRGHRR